MNSEPSPFPERTVRRLVAVCVVSLLIGAVVTGFGEDFGTPMENGPGVFSESALGHRGFMKVLERAGIPVMASRLASGSRAAGTGVLVLMEPGELQEVAGDVRSARRTLLVLPKWSAQSHSVEPRWIRSATLRPLADPKGILAEIVDGVEVLRAPDGGSGWISKLGPEPTLDHAQLLPLEAGTPLIHCMEGSLLTEFPRPDGGEGRILVLADPDILANHGLTDGDNAALGMEIVEHLREGSGAVIFDEVSHGYRRQESIWRSLLSPPLLLLTLQGLFLAGAIAWAGSRRFGAPETPTPPLDAGKEALLANTADLLRDGGHSHVMLRHYMRESIRVVAEYFRIPGEPGSPELELRLDRLATARSVSPTLEETRIVVDELLRKHRRSENEIVNAARGIGRWREEMLRGH